jgi:CubicO group peptidase (beta-lactamase class C family)
VVDGVLKKGMKIRLLSTGAAHQVDTTGVFTPKRTAVDGLWPEELASGPDGGWDKLRTGWRFIYPDSGMYSTAADLLGFLRLLRDGGWCGRTRVLPEAVVELVMRYQGHGTTMALGFCRSTTPYGQSAGTLHHLGNLMTYFWYDPRPDGEMAGVFLSQRLTNAVGANNMAAGLRSIFKAFVPAVYRAIQDRGGAR